MTGVTASISSPDLNKQLVLLSKVDSITNKHAFPAMQQSVKSMLAGWKDVAAVDTGIYRGTLKMDVKSLASGRIIQGSVKTFSMSPKGFPYPRALEDSVRYHYRGTRRRGQRTAGQVTRMFMSRIPIYKKLFAKAQRNIVKDLAVK